MFIILPVGVDYNARRYPIITFTFMEINVLVYLISWIPFMSNGIEGDEQFAQVMGLIPGDIKGYALITNLFTHVGFFHLLGNMIYLFLFGACVEDIIGRWQFVIFYLVGGLASDFMHILFSAGGHAASMPLIGASGAISACLGASTLLLGKTKINFRYWYFLFGFGAGEFWLPAWLVLSFWFLEDLAMAVLGLLHDSAGGGVAFGAHVGGFLGGFGVMMLFRRFRHPEVEVEEPSRPIRVQPRSVAQPNEQPSVYLYEGSQQSGPFTHSQVQDMLSCGSISGETLYWREGMGDWKPVGELAQTRG